jgi:murein DD-endopeptidase MepM/ murein hydrolase activator NlpD
VNPVLDELRFDLGRSLGLITGGLRSFSHPAAQRRLDWDIAIGLWTRDYLNLFADDQRGVLSYFQQLFEKDKPFYDQLRKAVIHNDSNDNNIVVSEDLIHPKINAIIDFGDSVYTQIINDLAIACAYAVMNYPDPLQAALPIVKGYHSAYALEEKELAHLYTAIGMRLVISVTKSAINSTKEPENVYLQISDRPAWDLLQKWKKVDSEFAHYSFREACGFNAHPQEVAFHEFARNKTCTLEALFPATNKKDVYPLDLRVSSKWIGHEQEFNDPDWFQYKINRLQKENPEQIIAGGYLEPRPIYTTSAYEKMGNSGKENRTVHLGTDFWLPAFTPVHALFDGEIVSAIYDDHDKGYGGLIILKHQKNNLSFYTLYGHLSKESVSSKKPGEKVKEGDFLAILGSYNDNGHWVPHLHFQFMLSLLDHKNDFPGVAFHNQTEVWKSICPDPNLLFKLGSLEHKAFEGKSEILQARKEHLGKS